MAEFPIQHKGTVFPEPMVPDEKINIGEKVQGRRMKTDYTIWNVYGPPVLRDRLHEVAEEDYRHPADYFIRSLNSLIKNKVRFLGPEESDYPMRPGYLRTRTERRRNGTVKLPSTLAGKKQTITQTLRGIPSERSFRAKEREREKGIVGEVGREGGVRGHGMQNAVQKQSLKEGTSGRKQRDVLAEQLERKPGIKEPYALATWQTQQKKAVEKQNISDDKKKDYHKDDMAHWCPKHKRWEIGVNKLMKSEKIDIAQFEKQILSPIKESNNSLKEIVKSLDDVMKEINA